MAKSWPLYFARLFVVDGSPQVRFPKLLKQHITGSELKKNIGTNNQHELNFCSILPALRCDRARNIALGYRARVRWARPAFGMRERCAALARGQRIVPARWSARARATGRRANATACTTCAACSHPDRQIQDRG